jgi:hypothetical protein
MAYTAGASRIALSPLWEGITEIRNKFQLGEGFYQ